MDRLYQTVWTSGDNCITFYLISLRVFPRGKKTSKGKQTLILEADVIWRLNDPCRTAQTRRQFPVTTLLLLLYRLLAIISTPACY